MQEVEVNNDDTLNFKLVTNDKLEDSYVTVTLYKRSATYNNTGEYQIPQYTAMHYKAEKSGTTIEKMIADQLGSAGNRFIRIGKSIIINRSYVYYINVTKQKLTLSDIRTFSHTVSASKEALKQLKEEIEKSIK